MDDGLLVGVLHPGADFGHQFEPLTRRQPPRVAVVVDRNALDVLHDEVGPPLLGLARVVHPGNARMVHQGQGLPLEFEPGHDRARVHARLDDLQGDQPA